MNRDRNKMNGIPSRILLAAAALLLIGGCARTRSHTPLPPPERVTAPASVSAAPLSSTSAYVTWVDVSDDESVFLIERAADVTGSPGAWSSAGSVLANSASFMDESLTPGATYWYRVSALKGEEPAAASDAVSVTLPGDGAPVAPPAPTGVLVAPSGDRELTVSWTDTSPNEVVFVVERAPDVAGSPGEWASAGIVLADGTSLADEDLTAGATYWYRVKALREGGLESSSEAAQGTVSPDTDPTPPAAPVEVQAEAQSSASVNVSWLDGGDDAPVFLVERAPDVEGSAGDWETAGIVLAGTTSFLVEWLEPSTTYWFRVTARSSDELSASSDGVSEATLAEDAPEPPAPPILEAPTAVSTTEVLLVWSDASDDEVSFTVERKEDEGPGGLDWAQIGSTLADLTSFTDTGVAAGTTYLYRVVAIGEGGLASPSAATRVTTPAEDDPVPPAAPTDVALEAPGSSSILVTWTDASDDEVAFVVERARDDDGLPGAWRAVGAVLADTTELLDEGLDEGTTYWYRVKAVAAGDLSATSGEVSTATPEPPEPEAPATPRDVAGTPDSPTAILVSWSDASDDEALFVIAYAADEGEEPGEEDWGINGYTPANETSFLLNGLTPNVTYWFRVTALGANGLSSASEPATATTPELPDPSPPAAPSLAGLELVGDTAVAVTWNDLSDDEVGFSVERAGDDGLGGSDWASVGSTLADVTLFVDYSVSAETSYLYRVVALAAPGIGATSDIQGITVPALEEPEAPERPTDLSLTRLGLDVVLVEWVDASDDELYFVVERAPDVEGGPSETWTEVTSLAAGATSANDTVEPGPTYWYRVTAVTDEGASATSDVTSISMLVTGPVSPPTLLEVVVLGPNSVGLFWEANAEGGDFFLITVAEDVEGEPGEWSVAAGAEISATESIVGELSPDTIYWFQVTQFNLDNYSSSSEILSARTGWVAALGGGGLGFSLVLHGDGTAWTWGNNESEILGDAGAQSLSLRPAGIGGVGGFVRAASGRFHALVLDEEGQVLAWGRNLDGQCGTGISTTVSYPNVVVGVSNVVEIAAGDLHSLALHQDGTVWAWGDNSQGQLGNGTTDPSETPVQVSELAAIVHVAAGGYSSMAIDTFGRVFTWGYNSDGQLGIGSTVNASLPTLVEAMPVPTVRGALGSSHAAVLGEDGRVYTWGYPWAGALGRDFFADTTIPARAPFVSNIVAVACGEEFSMALDEDGQVWCTGNNDWGQLGDGTETSRDSFTLVGGLTEPATAIAAGVITAYALLPGGHMVSWGNNDWGKLGTGTGPLVPTPAEVELEGIEALSLGAGSLMALLEDGSVWICGEEDNGELGNGFATAAVDTPIPLEFFDEDGRLVEVGNETNFAVERNTAVWSWGTHETYQIGTPEQESRDTPGVVEDLTGVIALSTGEQHVLALTDQGEVYAWGNNNEGQLGVDVETSWTPTLVPLPLATVAIAAGARHSLALLEDGTVWSWGMNDFGQLGEGSFSSSTEPVAVWLPEVQLTAIAAGGFHSMAIGDDGTVYTWGDSEYGQLGVGDFDSHNLPEPLWWLGPITHIAASQISSLAIGAGGEAWTWGDGSSGTIGDGLFTPYNPWPVAIELPEVVACESSPVASGFICLRPDGTAVAWGANEEGNLGIGDVLRWSSTPVRVLAPSED